MKTKTFTLLMILAIVGIHRNANSCTGITLKSADGTHIVARTVEWASGESPSDYIIVPHGHTEQSALPDGTHDGMKINTTYGYVGLASEDYVIEGLNEAGLSSGLFYFPKFGSYPKYNPEQKDITLSDTQFVAWVLGNFSTVDEVVNALATVNVVATDPRAETLHWRVADRSGRQIVIEYVNGIPMVYENKLGVLTNSPGYEWHITNLSNYVNLHPGSATEHEFGNISVAPIGHGSGLLGLPGDATPPSRFVRAAFYQTSAPVRDSAEQTVEQAFTILQAITIPIGSQFSKTQQVPEIPAATQWTSVADMTNGKLYYTTMFNPTIRKFDLNRIDFSTVSYQIHPLDETKIRPMVYAVVD